MTKYGDEQIRKLSMAFSQIDFCQPKAHEVFRGLETILEKIVLDNATSREYWFFKLGRSSNLKKLEFNNIPPLQEA
jgi:hypothetical protein